MKKKLLFVVSVAKFFISHRLSLAKAAQEAGYEVHVATPSSSFDEKIRHAGFIYHPIFLDRGGLNPFRDMVTLFSLLRLYRKIKPDIVHHVTLKPILYGGIAARILKIPAVVYAFTGLGFLFIDQSPRIKILRKLLGWIYRIAFRHKNMRVIFQNRDDQDYFIKNKLLSTENCFLVRGSGVSMSLFSLTPEFKSEVFVIFASRLLWDKGLGEFVEAARCLKNKNVHARFVLVGDLDKENPTSLSIERVNQWVSEGIIEWWGERDDMPEILQQAHVVCLPSYREGLPRVLVEAAASGRAIVATDTPGCRDVVRDGENGLLVPIKDSQALAIAIEKLIRNAELRQSMGRRGRELVERDFAIENIIQQNLTMYEALFHG